MKTYTCNGQTFEALQWNGGETGPMADFLGSGKVSLNLGPDFGSKISVRISLGVASTWAIIMPGDVVVRNFFGGTWAFSDESFAYHFAGCEVSVQSTTKTTEQPL